MRKLRTIEKDIQKTVQWRDTCKRMKSKYDEGRASKQLRELKKEYRAALRAAQLTLPGFKELGG